MGGIATPTHVIGMNAQGLSQKEISCGEFGSIAGEWAHSGKLGDLLAVRGSFSFFLDDESDVRMIPEYGGGCLWDVGVYPLSFAQYILKGPPVSVVPKNLNSLF